MKTALVLVLAAASLAACSPKPSTPQESASASAESATVSMAAADAASKAVNDVDTASMVGKWTGPEGTSLTITPQGEAYLVTVQNLDGPKDFTGSKADGGIQFVRDGTPYIIHKGDGLATGMKWLTEKKNCLIVTSGEGYCKD